MTENVDAGITGRIGHDLNETLAKTIWRDWATERNKEATPSPEATLLSYGPITSDSTAGNIYWNPGTRKKAVDHDGLKKLREAFPPSAIGKLPRKQHGSTIYLDYVGHAAVTARLLDVDPEWEWEPYAFDNETGRPLFERNPDGHAVGLWIRLTVCGVERPGYGSVAPGSFDAEKQLIGDAIRNAAMRFGVALDLWAKEDISTVTAADPGPAITDDDRAFLTAKLASLTPQDQADAKVWWRSHGLPPLLHEDFRESHFVTVVDKLNTYVVARGPLPEEETVPDDVT